MSPEERLKKQNLKLKRDLKACDQQTDIWYREATFQTDMNKKLSEALTFYADKNNWSELKLHTEGYMLVGGYPHKTESHIGWYMKENGETARKALGIEE